MSFMEELGLKAKEASYILANINEDEKNKALDKIAKALVENSEEIIKANEVDLKNAKENNIKESMLDRLTLNKDRIKAISNAIYKVINLADPVGSVDGGHKKENGLNILKTRAPLGVIGIIFESRPNVTVDAASLCLKSGNSCILRGGKEAINTNKALVKTMREALKESKVPIDAVCLVELTDRKYAMEMAAMDEYIDVIIPRGGIGLIKSVKEMAKVPVIETGVGNCHTYLDESCEYNMAINIVENAKCSRPSVCNAMETLLIHKNIAKEILPLIKERLDKYPVDIRGCEESRKILNNSISLATNEDYLTEYNDFILAVKIVDNIDEAISHIRKYTTYHSECIVTNNITNMNKFTSRIDAACVYVNSSTRFTDGEEFGLGAEIGISTQKLHTRGPMGLKELTTIKYIITGDGQIR